MKAFLYSLLLVVTVLSGCDVVSRRHYRDTPLAVVIEELQYYSPREIVLADPGLSTLQVTTILDARQTDYWIRHLPWALPVSVDDSDPQRLIIRWRCTHAPETGN